MSKTEYTSDEWIKEFYRRAGGEDWEHMKTVRFTCPACKTTYSVEDCFEVLGAQPLALDAATQNCIHHLKMDGECNSFGLFRTPVTVIRSDQSRAYVFDFAEDVTNG